MINKRATAGNQQLNPPIPPLPKGGKGGFEAGFTMVELLVSMVMFVVVIAAASQVFTSLLTQFKQQSKIAETNIEGIIGLELLRRDIEHAGYGLPWVIPAGIAYTEADSTTVCGTADPNTYDDAPPNPPKAILSGNNNCTNNSDYLVIKAINVATNEASEKWTHVNVGNIVKEWEPSGQRLETSDRVIVISMGTTRTLIVDGASFNTTYRADTDPDSVLDTNSVFAPVDATETRIVYGVTPPANPVTTDLSVPFNRVDFYVRTPVAANMPDRCAVGTGILYKATLNQGDGVTAGGGLNELPLLDCVADFQVTFWLDTDNDGDIDWPPSDNISGLTAQQIRDQLKAIKVYIVAHEGQKDTTYDFSAFGAAPPRIRLSATESLGGNSRTINFAALDALIGDPEYKYYRWKLYTLVVTPNNLGG